MNKNIIDNKHYYNYITSLYLDKIQLVIIFILVFAWLKLLFFCYFFLIK